MCFETWCLLFRRSLLPCRADAHRRSSRPTGINIGFFAGVDLPTRPYGDLHSRNLCRLPPTSRAPVYRLIVRNGISTKPLRVFPCVEICCETRFSWPEGTSQILTLHVYMNTASLFLGQRKRPEFGSYMDTHGLTSSLVMFSYPTSAFAHCKQCPLKCRA